MLDTFFLSYLLPCIRLLTKRVFIPECCVHSRKIVPCNQAMSTSANVYNTNGGNLCWPHADENHRAENVFLYSCTVLSQVATSNELMGLCVHRP